MLKESDPRGDGTNLLTYGFVSIAPQTLHICPAQTLSDNTGYWQATLGLSIYRLKAQSSRVFPEKLSRVDWAKQFRVRSRYQAWHCMQQWFHSKYEPESVYSSPIWLVMNQGRPLRQRHTNILPLSPSTWWIFEPRWASQSISTLSSKPTVKAACLSTESWLHPRISTSTQEGFSTIGLFRQKTSDLATVIDSVVLRPRFIASRKGTLGTSWGAYALIVCCSSPVERVRGHQTIHDLIRWPLAHSLRICWSLALGKPQTWRYF